ncbi:MAG: RNA ligase family protein [Pseudomonadota bacterium]|nr:RNA ligase family protein [Pseudomonadota bacterium]
MSDFFRFPRTPHLAWLGTGIPRDDKLLSPQEAEALLAGEVVVEEKLDGANLGISLGLDGQLRAQNRGQYLVAPFTGQFSRLQGWLFQHGNSLADKLGPGLVLFGEWCAARHSLDYDKLPDWFLLFDVVDRAEGRFWSTVRRNGLADELGLAAVPRLLRGRVTLADLQALLESRDSRFRAGPMEGVVIRRENADWCEARAKLARAEFTQTIGEHWRSRTLEWNRVQMYGRDAP